MFSSVWRSKSCQGLLAPRPPPSPLWLRLPLPAGCVWPFGYITFINLFKETTSSCEEASFTLPVRYVSLAGDRGEVGAGVFALLLSVSIATVPKVTALWPQMLPGRRP